MSKKNKNVEETVINENVELKNEVEGNEEGAEGVEPTAEGNEVPEVEGVEPIVEGNEEEHTGENFPEEETEDSENSEVPEVEGNEEETEEDEDEEVFGVVSECGRLNVRAEATKDSKVLTVINKGTKVKVNLEESTDDFYKVTVNSIEGYCVTDFITID